MRKNPNTGPFPSTTLYICGHAKMYKTTGTATYKTRRITGEYVSIEDAKKSITIQNGNS